MKLRRLLGLSLGLTMGIAVIATHSGFGSATSLPVATPDRVSYSRNRSCDGNDAVVVCSLTVKNLVNFPMSRHPDSIDYPELNLEPGESYIEYVGTLLDVVYGESLLEGEPIRFFVSATGHTLPAMDVRHLVYLVGWRGHWLSRTTTVAGVISELMFTSYWPGTTESWAELRASIQEQTEKRDPAVLADAVDIVVTGVLIGDSKDPSRPPGSYQIGSVSVLLLSIETQSAGPIPRIGQAMSMTLSRLAQSPRYAVGDTVTAFANWNGKWELDNTAFSMWRHSGDSVIALAPSDLSRTRPQISLSDSTFSAGLR